MKLLEFRGTVTTSAPAVPKFTGSVQVSVDETIPLIGDVSVDLNYSAAVKPRGNTSQLCSLAIEIDGFGIIHPNDLIPPLTWERDIDGGAKLTFTVRGDRSPIGNEMQWRGPVPGTKEITLWAAYVVGSSVKWTKLISGAITDSSSRDIGIDGSELTVTALGPEYRHSCKRISYAIRAGHGKTGHAIVKEILDELGVASVEIGDGDVERNKPLEINCEHGLEVASSIAESLTERLYFTRDNVATLVPAGYFDGAYSQKFSELDILTGSKLRIQADGGEVATAIVITGEEVITQEECGRVTTLYKTEIIDTFAPRGAYSRQNSLGSILSISHVPDVQERTRKLVLHYIERECGNILSELIQIFEWKNPLVWRYSIDSSGAFVTYNQACYFYETSGSVNANTNGYLWPVERFVQTAEVKRVYNYEDGKGVSLVTLERPPIGSRVSIQEWVSGYHLYKAALKGPRSGSDTWEATPFINARKILGSGEGVAEYASPGGTEVYVGTKSRPGVGFSGINNYFLSYTKEEEEVTPDGYVKAKTKTESGIWKRPGSTYLYFGDETGRDIAEYRLQNSYDPNIISGGGYGLDNIVTKTVDTYNAEEGGGLNTVTSITDYNRAIPKTETTISNSDGYLPQATIKDDPSTQTNSQNFERMVDAPVLLMSHVECVKEIQNQFIENPIEGLKYAVSELREGSALKINFMVPFNIPLEPAQKVHVGVRGRDVNHPVFIRTVGGSWAGRGQPIITTASGRIYVV